MPNAIITTSWDDGYTLDSRIADMLARHNLTGTFYIPRRSFLPVMAESLMHQLGQSFEIGAHTLNHVTLTHTDDMTAQREINDSGDWISDVTGRPCVMFCPPLGKFTMRDRAMIQESGYAGLRTVEGWALDMPRDSGAIVEMPVTTQVYPHGPRAHLRNLIKRHSWLGLCHYVRFGIGGWMRQSERLVRYIVARGGVFHLWGHSWEIEQLALWDQLDEALAMLARYTPHARPMTNGDICKLALFQRGRATRDHDPCAADTHAITAGDG